MPRDLAGTRYSSIHAEAYARLRPALGLPETEIRIVDTTQGLAEVHDDVLARFGADVGMVATGAPTGHRREVTSDGEVERFVDEWGVVRARPIGGLYYESTSAPLQGAIDSSDIAAFAWPDPRDPGRFAGMAERAPAHPRRRAPRGARGLAVRRGHGDAPSPARLRGRLHGPGRGPGPRPSADGAHHRAEAGLLGAGPRRDRRPHRRRRRGRRPGRPARAALLAAGLPRHRQAAARRARGAHQASLPGALLPPFVRRHQGPHPRSHRDRGGLPQPRPGLGGGHGYGGPEAGVRRRPHLLGRGRRPAACPGARHARRGRATRCAAASAT